MKYCWLALLLYVILSACTSTNESDIRDKDNIITIEGIIENGEDQLVTLDLMAPAEFISIDSMRCDKNGKFNFIFQGKGLNFYSLKFTVDGYITIIASPGDNIFVNANSGSIYPYNIKGSEASELVGTLARKHKTVLEELRDISIQSNEIVGDADYTEKKLILNNRFDSITNAFHDYSDKFIRENPGSPAILIALYNQFGPGLPVFDPLNDLDIYQFSDSALFANFPENSAVKALHTQLFTALQLINNQNRKRSLTKGMSAPDFVLESSEGEKIPLTKLRGKYVLLQIWASWSKPSVEENRYLEKCMQQFEDRDFAIYQVSLDNDRDEWLKSIITGVPNWFNVSDLKKWDSAIVNLYNIDQIPANFLIDPNGKILEINMFGENLINTLKKYLR